MTRPAGGATPRGASVRRAPGRAAAASGGFTMIEILVVVFVIALVAGIAFPRFRSITGAEVASATRRLAQLVRLLHAEAALRGGVYALHFDLDEERYWVTRLDPGSGEFVAEEESTLMRPVALSAGVDVVDVVLAGSDKRETGTVTTYFYPEGYADPSVIHLSNRGAYVYTLRIHPIRGIGEVIDGYWEEGHEL